MRGVLQGLNGRTMVVGVAALVAAAGLAACGSKPAASDSSSSDSGSAGGGTTSTASFSACMVLDTGGIDDKSFNESSYAGLTAAAAANSAIKPSYVPSNSSSDYTPNLQAEATKKCGAIIAVGGLMADNVKSAAAANPSLHYAEVDSPSSGANVYGIQFNTAQGAFLGGYLAAAYSKTGKVATFGGADIGPVTIYMDGFWEGVQYYNSKNKKNVQVLGWNEKKQKAGTFVPGNNPFGDQNAGQSISQTFIQQGADVIFPVAGGSGLGAPVAASKTTGVSVLWVDTDGCQSVAQYCKYFLSSVTKGLATSVQTYTTAAASGSYPTGSYIGTLKNGGTGLAPFHDYDSKVSASLKTQLKTITAGIESGAIKITSPSQPTA